MKHLTSKFLAILVFFVFTCSICLAQQPNPTKQFYDSINQKWNSKDYPQLLVLIENRLTTNPNDVWALMLKANYYVFAVKDITKAHQAAETFLSVINAGTSDQKLKDKAQKLAQVITNIPTTDTDQFTQAQKDALHQELEQFPYIDESLALWGEFTGQL